MSKKNTTGCLLQHLHPITTDERMREGREIKQVKRNGHATKLKADVSQMIRCSILAI